MHQQIDSLSDPDEDKVLDKRLAVVESTYVTREFVAEAKSEMRGWLLVQTTTLVFAVFGTFSLLHQKIQIVGERVARLEVRVDSVESRLDKVERRLDKVEQRLDSVEQRLERIESAMKILEMQQREILEAVRSSRGR